MSARQQLLTDAIVARITATTGSTFGQNVACADPALVNVTTDLAVMTSWDSFTRERVISATPRGDGSALIQLLERVVFGTCVLASGDTLDTAKDKAINAQAILWTNLNGFMPLIAGYGVIEPVMLVREVAYEIEQNHYGIATEWDLKWQNV
jgi:hypothetical protein